ncbi:MAG: hypothetical protein PVH61_21455 [Candidatus Aminicenantes bacterium]
MEKVTVTNVEVPVRVLYKGEPVANLSKDDFTIYENQEKDKNTGYKNRRFLFIIHILNQKGQKKFEYFFFQLFICIVYIEYDKVRKEDKEK